MDSNQEYDKVINMASPPEDSPLLLSDERIGESSEDYSLKCIFLQSMSSTVSAQISSSKKHEQLNLRSITKSKTVHGESRNTLRNPLKTQKSESLLLQNAYVRALNLGSAQEIATIITTLRVNEVSINMTPRTGLRTTEQTSLMQLAQEDRHLHVDSFSSTLMMQQYAKAIEMSSTTFSGDFINIKGASALMLAAFRGNVDAVTRLIPELGLISDDGWSALMLAASEGHTECVHLLYGEINLCGFTMLMYAVACDDYDRACRLIHLAGRQVSFKCDKGWSALMLAVKLRHYKIASLLVAEEIRLQTTNDWINDYTALLMLAKYSRRDDNENFNCQLVAETLLKEEGDLRNEKGETPLMIAASSGNKWLTQMICRKSNKWCAALKAQTYEGKTALMYAAERGHLEICELLANSEARISANDNKTALMLASAEGHSSVVQLLYQCEGGMELSDPYLLGKTALMFASEHGHVEVVKLLFNIEKGKSMKDGTTSLMLAAAAGQDKVLSFLISEARMQDKRGRTALILAAQSGSVACAKMLVTWEAKARDQHGNTALMHAARNGRTEIVSLMINYEAGATNNNGYSALMIASELGDRSICRLLGSEVGISGYTSLMFLVTTGAVPENFDLYKSQVGKRTTNGVTALMLAAINSNVEAIPYLIAEVGVQDWEGNTALMYACKSGFDSIVKELAKHETGFKNNDGMTALMLAAYYGKYDCLKLVLTKERHIPDDDGNYIEFYAKYPNHDDYNSKVQILALLDSDANTSDSSKL
ncbi:Protein 21.1 [Giardia lamblia P15]|uniref:Protein 21.1 n=1 Tax=Giardia intestinalis (strain P15) TaxID=658858 RepID=E1F3Y1_GIAIA|nr:Protein 21.1 [Giardia lamblia P15]